MQEMMTVESKEAIGELPTQTFMSYGWCTSRFFWRMAKIMQVN